MKRISWSALCLAIVLAVGARLAGTPASTAQNVAPPAIVETHEIPPTLESLQAEVRELRAEIRRLADLLEPQRPTAHPPALPAALKTEDRAVYAAVYGVGDVLPLHDPAVAGNVGAAFDSLIDLIVTGIAPESWGDNRHGKIERREANLTLVVANTKEVHQRVAAFLSTLRRLQTQIVLTTRVVRFGPEETTAQRMLEAAEDDQTVLGSAETKEIAEHFEGAGRANVLLAPRITLVSGSTATMEGALANDLTALMELGASLTRKGDVRLQIGMKLSNEDDSQPVPNPRPTYSSVVSNGGTLAFDITDRMEPAGLLERNPILRSLPNRDDLLKLTDLQQPGVRTVVLVTAELAPEVEEITPVATLPEATRATIKPAPPRR